MSVPSQGQNRFLLKCLLDTRGIQCSLSLLGLEGIQLLLLEGSRSRELKVNLVGGQLLVDVGEGLELGLHDLSVKRVEEDSLESLGLKGDTGLSSSDSRGGNDVLEDGGVNGLEGSGARSHLGGVVHG